MSKNPVLPFGIIALLGIIAVIIISFVGVDQRETRENPKEPEEVVELSAEDVFKNKCASCHGDDLTGNTAPGLTEVGSKYSTEEIEGIIINGKGDGMPGGLVNNEQAAEIAEWLSTLE